MLDHLFFATLRRHRAKTAVSDGQTTLSYQELDEVSAETARRLAPLLPGADRPRVGLRAGNSADYVVLYLALLRAGCVPFLIDAATGDQQTVTIVQDCGLDLLLHNSSASPVGSVVTTFGELTLSRFADHVDRAPLHDLTEVCRFTSGSTGRPQCIEFSGHAVHQAAANWVAGTGLTGDDRIVCFASLSNGLAFNTSLLAAFLPGAELHLLRGLPTASQVARTLERSRATRLVAFPALYESLLRRIPQRTTVQGLQMAISSAAPLRPEIRDRFTELTGVPVHNYYGVAEAGPLTFAKDPLSDPGLGQPLPGVSIHAGVNREAPAPIAVRSQSMGTRYLNAPGLLESRITPEGHYRTGDIGYFVDGSLVLTARTSHMINIAGRKIDAVEVAEVLRRAEQVRDAVVLEVPDRHGSSTLGAVIAAEPGTEPAAARRFAAERLPLHQVPTIVRVVDEIPCSSSGKPAMAELRRLFDQPGSSARHQ